MKKPVTWVVAAAVAGALVGGGALYLATRDAGEGARVVVSVNDIKDIAQLATVEYHMSSVVDSSFRIKWYEWKQARFAVFLNGVVTGSVDLNRADIRMPSGDSKTVAITFRKGAILVSEPQIGERGMQTFTLANPNVLHPITDAQRDAVKSSAIAHLKQSAIDAGIVTRTAAEARRLLTGFLAGFGYTAQIEFEDLPDAP